MTESAAFHTRILPHGVLAFFLLTAGTVAMGGALVAAFAGLPMFVTVPLLLVILGVLARRRGFDAEYQVGPGGISERLTPLRGGPPRERKWPWSQVQSYTLDRVPTRSPIERNVLQVRLPGYRLRLPEPVTEDGRDAHARFVDRFVGYATGDVAAAGSLGQGDEPRVEALRRRPMTTGEAPQLRRTLEHRTAQESASPESMPFLDRPLGRLMAGLGALVILGGAVAAAALGATVGAWVKLVLVLVPSGLWLAWRALRGSDAQ